MCILANIISFDTQCLLGKTVKKTMSKPQIKSDNERTPLLSGEGSQSGPQRDLMGSQSSADWDAASLENSERPFPAVTEATPSMSNYVVLEDEESDPEIQNTDKQAKGGLADIQTETPNSAQDSSHVTEPRVIDQTNTTEKATEANVPT